MTAALELLIYVFMTTAAVAGSHLRGDGESVVFFALLICRRLMAVETGDALLPMPAHLVFMYD